MSATYEPGTVAVVNGRRALRVGNIGWHLRPATAAEEETGADFVRDSDVTDVRPLVVLDPTTSPEPLNSTFAATFLDAAAEIVEASTDRTVRETAFLRWLADQIEAQSRPPRIPEPGPYGVVVAASCVDAVRTEFVHTASLWRRTSTGAAYRWDELIDPVLVRDGIEVVS